MSYCYTPVDSPSFFYGAGDCETVRHDLRIDAGDLAAGDDLVSAALIQLGTDARVGDERGWWGDEFQPFPIGNQVWSMTGLPASVAGTSAKVDEHIRAALAPLISSGLIDEITVTTVKTIDGFEIALTLKRGGSSIMKALING